MMFDGFDGFDGFGYWEPSLDSSDDRQGDGFIQTSLPVFVRS